jgi:hypothetical protein
LRALALCRELKCSWRELQEMPEEVIDVWEAIITGEGHAARVRAAGR